jgi:ribosomal protein L40E
MTEILTESFCERCGTRYTFESVALHQHRMGGIRVLGRGLKNFVMSDDSSLDEAMAAARSDEEREATAQQLDAFHRTFNFCMSCRQYTCGNCWNDGEARCLSCAPMAAVELAGDVATEGAAEAGDIGPDLERLLRVTGASADGAWAPDALQGPAPGPGPELEVVAWPEAGADAAEEGPIEAPEDVALAAPEEAAAPYFRAAPEPATPDATTPEAASPDATAEEPAAPAAPAPAQPAAADLIHLEPGESLDEAIAAYEEAQTAGVEASRPGVDIVAQPTWPTAPVAAEPEPEPVAAAEGDVAAPAEGDVAAPAPTAEPTAAVPPAGALPAAAALPPAAQLDALTADAEPEAVSAEPEAATPAPEVRERQPEVTAPEPEFLMVAPENEPSGREPAAPSAPVVPPVPAAQPPDEAPSGPPQWPTGPRWPTGIPARQPAPPPAPATDRLAAIMARQATEAMWAASSVDVLQPPLATQAAPTAAVQPCVSCGISLSATARFCRRCGTSQNG